MINKEILKEESILLPIEYDEGNCEKAIYDRLSKYEDLLKNYSIGLGCQKVINLCYIFVPWKFNTIYEIEMIFDKI